MKKSSILKRLHKHHDKKRYVRLTREMGYSENLVHGFIVNISEHFIVLQENIDFKILGYMVIPISVVTYVRYNKNDATVDRILREEGQIDKVNNRYELDLSSWQTLCADLQQTGLTVISECEQPERNYFCIGKIENAGKKHLSIRYFNAEGILDKKDTRHKYKWITKLRFDDQYANVFSKYVHEA